MSTMKDLSAEFRLRLVEHVAEVLFDLADTEGLDESEHDMARDSFADAAQVILDSVDFTVIEVDPEGKATVEVTLPPRGFS